MGISLGSIVMGVGVGLICSLMCKYTDLGEHDGYEVALLFMMAYASYAISEAVGLSGIMSLFFCGIVLSHYNWCGRQALGGGEATRAALSWPEGCHPTSSPLVTRDAPLEPRYNLSADGQISSSAIFKSVAMVSETLVFAYMGVVLFTGDIQRCAQRSEPSAPAAGRGSVPAPPPPCPLTPPARRRRREWAARDCRRTAIIPLPHCCLYEGPRGSCRWDLGFVVLGILSCLFARLFNTFPLSWLVNLRRKKPIPRNMQGVIWFAGAGATTPPPPLPSLPL